MATSDITNCVERKWDRKLGYECEFVQPSPSCLQTECSVCQLVLRSPHLISCCGYNFCKECIEGVQKAGNNCPLCNATGYYLLYNRAHYGTLKLLEVYCTHRISGCEWKGKLEMLEKHLNVDPKPETRLQGCEYVVVKCRYKGCGQSIKRHLLRNHQSKECPQRPFGCEHCNNYTATFHDVTTNHWHVCECYPVSCPNNCTPNKIQRQDLERHLSEECPLQEVECEFKYAGCETKLCRKDIPEHTTNSKHMAHHISLLVQHILKQNKDIEELRRQNVEVKQHTEDIEELHRQNVEVKQHTEGIEELRRQNVELKQKNLQLTKQVEMLKLRADFNDPAETKV